jgi:mitochondrial Rho GTPase 1
VETVLECSAKTIFLVDEAFDFAIKAVLYPTQPLYDMERSTFKPASILAFERIFRLCDVNYDGFWDDAELNRFQTRCYPAEGPLDASAISDLKALIKELDPQGVDPVKGITVKGLVALQHVMIVRGRMETIWAGLRAFGYSNDLNLAEEFVKLPAALTASRVSDATEISAHGRSFVVSLFGNCSRASRASSSGAPSCSVEDVISLFSIIPEGKIFLEEQLEFPHSLPLVSQSDGSKVLDRKSWDALWSLMSLVDPQRTYQYLNLLGYEPPQGSKREDTLMQLASMSADNKGQTVPTKERTSFLCYVVGSRSVGKSSLLRKFVDQKAPSSSSLSAEFSINAVGQDWLVLRTFGPEEKSVLESDEAIDKADSIAVCFDVSDAASLTYAMQVADSLRKRFSDLPITLVATCVAYIHSISRYLF